MTLCLQECHHDVKIKCHPIMGTFGPVGFKKRIKYLKTFFTLVYVS